MRYTRLYQEATTMKLNTKYSLALIVAIVLGSAPVFAQPIDIADIQKGAETLSKSMAKSLPFNSTLGLNWSDAHIGQLIAIPPHFGAGVMFGATSMNSDDLSGLLGNMGFDTKDLPDNVPLPAIAAEGRIGGFILPFDIGLKVGMIPESVGQGLSNLTGGLDVDYLLVGADFRYALLDGGLIMPKLSVGAGFNYLKGGMGTKIGSDIEYDYGSTPLLISAPKIGIEWESSTIDLKAQISKSFLVITPYAGIGLSHGWSTASYYVESNTNLSDAEIQELNDYLKSKGQEPLDASNTGFSSSFDANGWAFRGFGGVSLNILLLKLDITGLYNFADNSYGASLGIRFQL